MSSYYQPSGQLPPTGIWSFLAGGFLTAAVLAFGYIFLLWRWPALGIFLPLVFGFGLGTVLKTLARWGKLRHPRRVGHLGMLVGLAALYLQWSVYLTLRASPGAVINGHLVRANGQFRAAAWLDQLAAPRQLFAQMVHLNALAIDDSPLASGWYLLLFWGGEALTVVGLARLLAREQAQVPFSEATNAWARVYILPRPANPVRDLSALRTALEAGDLQALARLSTTASVAQLLDRPPSNFVRLKRYYAPGDAECHYLTVESFTRKSGRYGPSFGVKLVVEYLCLTAAAAAELQARFGPALPAAPGAAGRQVAA